MGHPRIPFPNSFSEAWGQTGRNRVAWALMLGGMNRGTSRCHRIVVRVLCGPKDLGIRRQRQWRRPNAQVLRWESSAPRLTPRPQDDRQLGGMNWGTSRLSPGSSPGPLSPGSLSGRWTVARLPSQATTFVFDSRSLFVPVTMQTKSRSPFDSPSLTLSVRPGQALDFARDDNGWGGLNLHGQNPHSNFAKSAKLEWGTLGFLYVGARCGLGCQ